MIKKTIYPKTSRVESGNDNVIITEKLDGSNLVIFKKEDKLYIAQRNNIFELEELSKDVAYKGLYQWIQDNKDILEQDLINDSAVCGEWLGMGQLKYDVGEFNERFYMFAKANVDDDFELYNIYYDRSLFIYPFKKQEIPKFIGVVPKVCELKYIPSKQDLDKIYENYCIKVGRNVEGFVVNYRNIISKYIRMKNGKAQEHKGSFRKGAEE